MSNFVILHVDVQFYQPPGSCRAPYSPSSQWEDFLTRRSRTSELLFLSPTTCFVVLGKND